MAALLLATVILVCPCTAWADFATLTTSNISVPYVDDVSEYDNDEYVITIIVAGNENARLKIIDEDGKKVKLHKRAPRVWYAVINEGETYEITAALNRTERTILFGIKEAS